MNCALMIRLMPFMVRTRKIDFSGISMKKFMFCLCACYYMCFNLKSSGYVNGGNYFMTNSLSSHTLRTSSLITCKIGFI